MQNNKFHIRNIKITYRLFSAFCSLVLLVILVISTSQFYRYRNETKRKIGDYAIDNLTQVAVSIDNTLSRMDDYYLDVASNALVQDALLNPQPAGSIDYLNNQFRFRELVVQKYSFFKYIKNIYILDADLDLALAYTNISGDTNLSREDIGRIAETNQDSKGERRWMAIPAAPQNSGQKGKNKDSVILHSLVYPNWNMQMTGYMIAELRPAFFLDAFAEPLSVAGIETFLLDRNGVMIASFNSRTLPIGQKHHDPEIMNKIAANRRYFDYKNETQSGMLASVPIKNTVLVAVSIIPDSYFVAESQGMKSFIMVTVMIFLLLSAVITFVIMKSIQVPLKQLSGEMDRVRQGDFTLPAEDLYHDELSDIRTNFFVMVKEVKRLTQDIREHARQKKIAEIAALQAQINPHFLSNTLGSIQWMASLQGADNIEDIVKNLINLLHMCARKSKNFLSLEEELEYVTCYVNVQKYRYLDKFEVVMDIAEEVLDAEVPQFILQPLIENAIIHGIEPMPGQGRIEVRCRYLGEGRVRIEIEDNGVGITPERIDEIMNSRQNSKGSFNNIGLNNIRDRLVLYYDRDFGFEIESGEGTYTKVKLELPMTKPAEAEQ